MRLKIDKPGFTANERIVANDMGNTILGAMLRMQQHFGLRAEPFQVFFVIVLATVQKLLRNPDEMDPATRGTAPLRPEHCGTISRRRIAEVLDIPLETVRRHVAQLLAEGLLEERGRGELCSRDGILVSLSQADIPLDVARDFVSVVNAMGRRGALG